MEQKNQDTSLKRRLWISSSILISIGLILGGVLYYRAEKSEIRREKYDEISSVAELKVSQIESWRSERLEDARVLSRSPFSRDAILGLVKSPTNAQLRKAISARLALETRHGLYSDAFLLDITGRTLVSVGSSSSVMDTSERDAFHKAVLERTPVLTDLFRGVGGTVHIDVMDAIFDESGKPAAVVLLRSDADSFLYPLVKSWPIPSRSAETLLGEKKGNDIVFLNSLLFNSRAALSLRIPLTSTTTPAVQAAMGRTGIFEGKDYEGVDVLADLRPVPNTPWFMVAKVDAIEILAEAHYRGGVVALFVLLFIAVSATATAYVYRHRQAGIYRKMYQSELERKEVQEEFKATLYSIGDAVITTGIDGLIKQMNPAAERLTGWTENEAKGISLHEVFHIVNEETRSSVESPVQRVLREGIVVGLANHTLLISRDGAEHPIADSSAPIRDESGNVTGVVLIFRDRTQEGNAERKVRESEEKYRSLFNNAEVGMFRTRLDGSGILEFNERYLQILDYTREEVVGKSSTDMWANTSERDEMVELLKAQGHVTDFECGILNKQGEVRRCITSLRLYRDTGILEGSIQDITERKKAEEALTYERNLLKALMDNIPDRIYFKDKESRFLRISKSQANAFGLADPLHAVGKTDFDFFAEDHARPAFEDEQKIMQSGIAVVGLEEKESWPDGRQTWVSTTKVPLRNAQGEIIGTLGISRDITERRQAETALRTSEAQLSNAVKMAHMGHWEYDVARDLFTFNDHFYTMFRTTAGQVGGYTMSSAQYAQRFVHPDDLRLVGIEIQKALETTDPDYNTQLEHRIIYPDGQVGYITVRIFVVKDEQGRTIKTYGVNQDITERKEVEKTLATERNRLRALIDNLPDHIYTKDIEGRFTVCNTGEAHHHGLSTPNDLLGKTDFDFYPRELAEQYRADEQAIIQSGQPMINREERTVDATGNTKWDSTTKVPFCDPQGKIIGLVGISRDITERKRAEETLRQSQERYRLLYEYAPVGIVLADLSGEVLEVNPSALQILGSPSGEATKGINLLTFPPLIGAGISDAYKRCIETRQTVFGEYPYVTKWGKAIYMQMQFVPISGDQDHVTLVHTIIEDITERKIAEKALRESEEKFRGLVEGLTAAISITDGKRFFYANPPALKMLGYTTDEVPRLSFTDIVHPDYKELVMKRAAELAAGKDVPKHYELQLLTKSGEGIWVDFSATLINYNGVLALITSAYDISDRKKLEDQLVQAQKMEGIGRLAGGVAHDYNNMLGVIIGYSDLIMKKVNKSKPIYHYVELIGSAARRGADITRQLLAFARREIASPRALDPNNAIETLQKMLQRLIGENVKLTFLPAKNVWNIKIDPTQLDQVLFNLATNSRDAIDNVGTITIETSNTYIDKAYAENRIDFSPGEYVVISFTDTGKGMSKETMKNIFEPFFTTKSKGQGTGLGLSTVYGIVKQNGGSIHAYSEIGVGTTFKIYLPRYEGEVEATEAAQVETAIDGTETVLVVEDQADLLELAKNSLQEYGYKVLTALSPEDGIRLCEEYNDVIHLLLTDVIMPMMNGKELRDKIQAIKPDIKTVFMSGYTANVIAHQGVLDHGVDFIQKPFSPYALAKKVHEVLKAGESK